MTTLGELGEFGFIDRIAKHLPADSTVRETVGDDCAVIELDGKTLVATCDIMLEDIHFRRGIVEPAAIGWKAAAINLSDVAAMGGTPRFALVSIAAPPDTDAAELESLCAELARTMQTYGAFVVGGDTARANDGLVIDVALVGDIAGDRYLTRRGAQPGDVLAVTGWPGRAAAGLFAQENGHDEPALLNAHYRPVPRVSEGQWLCAQSAVRAMIDVSDGVAQDAGHLAAAASLGLELRSDALSVDPRLAKYCVKYNLDARALILAGGEDYELAVALDPGAAEKLSAEFEAAFDLPLTIVGTFVDSFQGVRVDGATPDSLGFDHFRSGPGG